MTVPAVRRGLQRRASAASRPDTGATRATRGAATPRRIRESGPTRKIRPAAPRTSTDTVIPSAPKGRRRATHDRDAKQGAPRMTSSGIGLPGSRAWCLPWRTPPGGMREAARAGPQAPTSEARIPRAIPCPTTEALERGLARGGDPVDLLGRLPHHVEERTRRTDPKEHAEDSPRRPDRHRLDQEERLHLARRRPEGAKRPDVAPAAVHGDGEGVEDEEGADPEGEAARDVEAGDEVRDEALQLASPAVRRFDAVGRARAPSAGRPCPGRWRRPPRAAPRSGRSAVPGRRGPGRRRRPSRPGSRRTPRRTPSA